MLRVEETAVERARYPVIDVHTHLTFRAKSAAGVPMGEGVRSLMPPAELLPVMDRRNVQTMVNLTGGIGEGLETSVREFQAPHPERFLTFTEPSWHRAAEPGYPQVQAEELAPRATAPGRRA
jgi:hypothetical protein